MKTLLAILCILTLLPHTKPTIGTVNSSLHMGHRKKYISSVKSSQSSHSEVVLGLFFSSAQAFFEQISIGGTPSCFEQRY